MSGRGWQIALASAAPQSCPSTYAQYSVGSQVNPAKPPQARGVAQLLFVQPTTPSEQLHTLQPSSAGMLAAPSGYVTPLTTQLRPDPAQGPERRTPLPAREAAHELAYVRPSHPHTGAYMVEQASGLGLQVASASAAPQYDPSV